MKNLTETIGLNVGRDDVLSAGETDPMGQEWSGPRADKKYRRAFVANSYRILLLIGDDLRDFVSADRQTIDERKRIARSFKAYWADRWVMIPNPTYGSWETATYSVLQALPDAERLSRKRSLVQGFGSK